MNDYHDIMRRLPPELRETAQDHGTSIVFGAQGWTREKIAASTGLPLYEIHTHPRDADRFWIYVNPNRSTTHAADDSRICS